MINPKHTDTSRSGDLVKQLREYRAYCPNNDRDDHPICDEAADRIEALEAALRTLINEHKVLGFVGGPSAEAWDAARAALGEKQ